MFFKGIMYIIYMLAVRIKGIKYSYLKKYKGNEAADKFVEEIAMKWSTYTIKTIGIEIEVEGKENIPTEPCVFISNHTSILDIPILFKTISKPIGFIAKKEMLKVPVLGYWLEKAHCVPLDRSNAREAVKSISEGVKNIKEGFSMVIFPEGTRGKRGRVGEFKKGSLKLATRAKALIVPVTIEGANKGFEDERRFKPCKVRVVFGKPINPSELSKEELVELATSIREEIVMNIKENGLNESLDTISGETGISVKNLNRFMGYEEFKNYKKEYEKSLNNGNSKISLN